MEYKKIPFKIFKPIRSSLRNGDITDKHTRLSARIPYIGPSSEYHFDNWTPQ